MEDLFNSVYSTHKGISFSTVVVFGAFIFLILQVHLSYKGRISDVLRKTSFFSMILLYIQGILGVFLGIYSPEFSEASGFSSYFKLFEYGIIILTCAGMITYVYMFLKRNQILTLKVLIIALAAALLFEYAYPWRIIFG
jgi:hypothetical protein